MSPQEAWPDDIPEDNTDAQPDMAELIESIQSSVFHRRIRIKDAFADFDTNRNGRISKVNFARALNRVVPSVKPWEADALADHFTEHGPQAHWPKVVSYSKFCQVIDEIFGPSHLEVTPMAKVPLPGATLTSNGDHFKAATRHGDEDRIGTILNRIATLARSRGVDWHTCCRAHVSSECPRHSGKITADGFLRRFPFSDHFEWEDIQILLRRYTDKAGIVHMHAFQLDVEGILAEAELAAEKLAGLRREDDENEQLFLQQKVATPTGSQLHSFEGPQDTDEPPRRQRPKSAYSRLSTSAISEASAAPGGAQRRQRPMSASASYSKLTAESAGPRQAMQRPMSAGGSLSKLTQQQTDVRRQRPSSAPMQRSRPGAKSAANLATAGFTTSAMPSYQDVIAKLKNIISKRRLRIHDRFVDFDRLRKGVVTRSQMRTTLGIMRIDLRNAELEVLEAAYSSVGPGDDDDAPPTFFRYKEFCADVSGVQEPDYGAVRNCGNPALQKLLTNIRAKAKARRLELLGAFDDRCQGKPAHRINRSTALRIMHMLGFAVTEREMDLLCLGFGDDYGFNYLAFCTVVDPFLASETALFEDLKKPKKPPTTRYFDLSGDVVAHPRLAGSRPASAPMRRR
eukprot:gb/GFBE01053199.1/.p1 GENE.gb/GFBE01053199.1/~~gb/GFBE01053199.1/.p1  ORF type:complete len:626 (+),score=108.69 gb/GFBE01053199.1/:1-1878(+)